MNKLKKWSSIFLIACMVVTSMPFIPGGQNCSYGAEELTALPAPVVLYVQPNEVGLQKTEGYEYSKDGKTWQSSNVFTQLRENQSYTFIQRVTLDDGRIIVSPGTTVITPKDECNQVSGIPQLVSKGHDFIRVYYTTAYEWSMDGVNWTTSGTFKNLKPDTTYYIYQRYRETSWHYAGPSSLPLIVKTKALPEDTIAPVVESVTATEITLKAVEGYEYSADGTTWQESPVLSGLDPLTTYTVQQRFAENEDVIKGTAASLEVKTKKAETVPEGYMGIYTVEDLDRVRNLMSGKYILMNDIVFDKSDFQPGGAYYHDGAGWNPIGAEGTKVTAFTGSFNGNGYTISGLEMYRGIDGNYHFGLFAFTRGVVKNLGMSRCIIDIVQQDSSETRTEYFVGAIAGKKGDADYYNCYNACDISVQSEIATVGGLVGEAVSVTFYNCFNTGNIKAVVSGSTHSYVGGITGDSGRLVHCYNTGSVVSVNQDGYYSNMAGLSSYNPKVDDSYSLQISNFTDDYYRSYKDMCAAETYEKFDFTKEWEMNTSTGYPFPQLQDVPYVKDVKSAVAKGTGEVYNPYHIASVDEFKSMEKDPGAWYVLDCNLDLQGEPWMAVCSEQNPFFGSFDGQGHLIQNLYVCDIDEEGYLGLFGYNAGIIENLTLQGGEISVLNQSHDVVTIGTVAAYNNGTIRVCKSLVPITVTSKTGITYIGGIQGEGYTGTVFDSSYEGTMDLNFLIQSSGYIGGIVGRLQKGKVIRCYSTADIDIDFSSGNESCTSYCGGVFGYAASSSVSVQDVYNQGSITVDVLLSNPSKIYTGGIGGYGNKAVVTNCYNAGKITSGMMKNCGEIGDVGTEKNAFYFSHGNGERNDGTRMSYMQMLDPSNYINFDFENVWMMDTSETSKSPYPQLRKQPQERQQEVFLIEKCQVELEDTEFLYTGEDLKPKVTVKNGTKVLVYGQDYELVYENKVYQGTGKVTVHGISPYVGTQTVTYCIKRTELDASKFSLEQTDFIYDGTEKRPKVKAEGLVEGKDYSVFYHNNIDAGIGLVSVHGSNIYEGNVSLTFMIRGIPIETVPAELEQDTCAYTGSMIMPKVKIEGLQQECDYTVQYVDCIQPGQGKAVITGIGNYAGETVLYYTILPKEEPKPEPEPTPEPEEPTPTPEPEPDTPKPHQHTYKVVTKAATTEADGSIVEKCECGDVKSEIAIAKISSIRLSANTFAYNGKAKCPKLTIKDTNGKILKKGVDYEVAIPNGRKYVGKYTYHVALKGDYSGRTQLMITIKPAKTSVKSLTAGKKTVTVKWQKVKAQATGYQVMYSTSKSFRKGTATKTKSVFKAGTTSLKITKLKPKTRYYVKVRAFKTVKKNGKSTKIYSSWSTVKNIRTK